MKHLLKSMFKKFGFVSALMIIFVSPSAGWAVEKIDIRYFAQGKKVIPVVCQIGDWQITDIKLPDLIITNGRKTPVTVDQIDVIGKVSGVEVLRLRIAPEELQKAIGITAEMLNKQRPPLPTVQLAFGDVVIPEGLLSENGTAVQGQSILLPLSRITYFHYVGHSRIDSLQMDMTFSSGSKKTTSTFPVQLTPYEAKGKYIFPLKGDLHLAFVPLSYIHHRGSASQEFAMDVVGANQSGASSFIEISTPNPKNLSDYGIWGKDVLSAGDGVVVETGDQFPEALMSDPAKFGNPKYTQNLLKDLIGKIGWMNAVAGNYVTIDHGNGEFSTYCHLKEGSLKVKLGDKVTRGTVIAQVGNTGNSGAPHLHFQLMDSRNFFVANGLPVMFENLPASAMIVEYPVKANTLSFSDNLYHAVP